MKFLALYMPAESLTYQRDIASKSLLKSRPHLKGNSMVRKFVVALAFAMTIPAAALACNEEMRAQKADNSETVLLAQADTTKPKAKAPKKGAKKKHKAPDSMK